MSSFNKKTRNPGWRSGDHWVVCQRTGMIIRSSDARVEWNGLIVAKEEWEPRHPQDYLRGREDNIAARGIVNPEGTDRYGEDIDGNQDIVPAIAGIAVAGVSKAGEDYEYDQLTDVPTGTFTTNNETL